MQTKVYVFLPIAETVGSALGTDACLCVLVLCCLDRTLVMGQSLDLSALPIV
jgi:hypothetical protein